MVPVRTKHQQTWAFLSVWGWILQHHQTTAHPILVHTLYPWAAESGPDQPSTPGNALEMQILRPTESDPLGGASSLFFVSCPGDCVEAGV